MLNFTPNASVSSVCGYARHSAILAGKLRRVNDERLLLSKCRKRFGPLRVAWSNLSLENGHQGDSLQLDCFFGLHLRTPQPPSRNQTVRRTRTPREAAHREPPSVVV